MKRSDLKTELGKNLYDYSELPKNEIPDDVLEDISSSFFIRNEIDQYEFHQLDQNISLFLATAEASMKMFFDWNKSFTDFGYHPPILEFTS